ncbi:hypothetical protein M8J75_013820 [Diaphorina citri]|nr:hypothetical protein M8J75_013820 [Diaphorina citri]KAI5753375.1 hypothetical protein M8J77_026354 [Diaphorina citri]
MAGCLNALHLSEDNARILLLILVLGLYMLLGALFFQYLESPLEQEVVEKYWRVYNKFRDHFVNDSVPQDLEEFHNMLYAYGNATAIGIIHKKPRWDFSGSFHFVTTIVSTIGYGSTAPQTTPGKLFVIVYGFLGCSGGILFFNLFLERIITLLAYILRALYIRKLLRSGQDLSEDERNESLEEWKPSVYWVMLCLIVASIVIAGCASFVYVPYENWTYLESIYFCFVSFSTIGFGDYVSAQAIDYPNSSLYSFWNYIFLILGCSCIYSLFNVTSIVIKQFLNWLIYEMDMFCCRKPPDKTGRVLRRHSIRVQRERERRRRSSITLPKTIRRERNRPLGRICDVVPQADDDSNGFDENSDGARRLSGELISMKDLLTANKVSLAVMQKQLYETAQMQREGQAEPWSERRDGKFTPGTVGPLAIVSKKLGSTK